MGGVYVTIRSAAGKERFDKHVTWTNEGRLKTYTTGSEGIFFLLSEILLTEINICDTVALK